MNIRRFIAVAALCCVLPVAAACTGSRHEHSFLSYMVTEPSCTESGMIEQTCPECGKKVYSAVEALGHNYVDGICTRCGRSDGSVPEEPEDPSEHEHVFINSLLTQPGCTTAGVVEQECSDCGEKQYIQIEALGHNYVGGICTRCGQSDGSVPEEPDDPDEPDLSLFMGMHEAYLYAQQLGYAESEDYFVEGIPGMRFSGLFIGKNGNLKVQYSFISADIGDVRVDLPAEGAAELGLINAIEVSSAGNLIISDATGKVKDFGRLEPYRYYAGSTYIAGAAVNMQNELLLLQSGGKIIKAGFINQNNAVEVVDDLLLYIYNGSYYSAYGALNENIERIDVAPTHLGVPVKAVHSDAFNGYKSLKCAYIAEGVQTINYRAFKECAALEYIVLPQSLISIYSNAFTGCSSLEAVFFCGTEQQWESVYGSSFVYGASENVQVYFYSEVGPVVGENYWHYVDGEPVKW